MWHPLVWQIHSVGIALFAMGDPAQAASGSGLMAYNTRVVLLGTMFLGMCSGVIGTFMLLRKKALVGDVATHEVPDLTPFPMSRESLIAARGWSPRRFDGLLRSAIREGWLRQDSEGQFRFTDSGTRLAARAVRNHRLWELYLIHFADVAPSRVDREADLIEHVLEPGLVEQLEKLLEQDRPREVPSSPHS